jgi:hypothetical protein
MRERRLQRDPPGVQREQIERDAAPRRIDAV